jgi:hypothetical protein
MDSARWLFVVLFFWLGATLWCNLLEPAKADLVPSEITTAASSNSTSGGLADASLATPTGWATKVWGWITILWKALTFDYGIFTGYLFILRIICIFFSVAGLYFIADIAWKIRSIALGG